MCTEFMNFVSHLNHALLPFLALLGIILWVAGEPAEVAKKSFIRVVIDRMQLGEKNRWKGLLIALSGGIAGAVISYNKPECEYQWLYESFAQTSYIFASAVAAVFITHGYKYAIPSEPFAEKSSDADSPPQG
jgi:hypothetical protein